MIYIANHEPEKNYLFSRLIGLIDQNLEPRQ